MHFRLALSGEKVKPHQTTALHLITAFTLAGMGGLCFLLPARSSSLYMGGTTAGVLGTALVLSGLVLTGIVFTRNRWLLRPRVNRAFRATELVVVLCLTAFLALLQLWIPVAITGLLGGALIFSLYWEQGEKQTLYIAIDGDGIRLPGIGRSRFLSWPEVERVLLRFGVLTIDCQDNRLFQWNIAQADFDKETFEAWCAQQIAEGKSRRSNFNDW